MSKSRDLVYERIALYLRKLVNLKSMIVVTNGICIACLIDTTRRYAKAGWIIAGALLSGYGYMVITSST